MRLDECKVYTSKGKENMRYSMVWDIYFCRTANSQILYGNIENIIEYFEMSHGIKDGDYEGLGQNHIIPQLAKLKNDTKKIEVVCPIVEDYVDCYGCEINICS